MLTISSRHTGARVQWEPTREQVELWHLLSRHQHLLIAKPRKTGISTAVEHDDLMWTMACDIAGACVRCIIAIDTDDKAKQHAAQLHDFARQWRWRGVSTHAHGLAFPGGSRVDCITAGGDEPGRGGTIHRLHVTELPYWSQPAGSYHALRSSCTDSAQVIVETTMDSISEFAQHLWDGARARANRFHAHFWNVQSHASYRLDAPLTADEWGLAQRNGFTVRGAAAWWLKYALVDVCGGDFVRLMHDFPQTEEHLFAVGTGRVIVTTPPPAVVVKTLDVPGLRGDVWRVEIYGESYYDLASKRWTTTPIAHSAQVAIGVDTAMGRGKTNSVVFAFDKRDRRPLACFWSSLIRYDDLARVCGSVRDYFSMTARGAAELVVEEDGAGDATCQLLEGMGVPIRRFAQAPRAGTSGQQERCITAMKTRCEAGMRGAPQILRDEVKRFHRNERGDYAGPKDAIMAGGMALVHTEEHPWVPVYDVDERKSRVYFEERLREDRSANAVVARPPWGN